MYIKLDARSFTVCHDYSNFIKTSNVAEFSWSSLGPQPSQKRERNLRRRSSIRKLQLVVVPVRNGYTAKVKKCTKTCKIDPDGVLAEIAIAVAKPF